MTFQIPFIDFVRRINVCHVFDKSCFLFQINYCYILKQLQHDNAKTGIQFNFSSPS